MKNLFKKLFGIHQGELGLTAIMFCYNFLLIASYYILKPMTRSLFLKNQGPTQLPYVYMLVALVVGVVAVLYARLASNISLKRMINRTTIFIIGNLLAFWWLLKIDVRSEWLYYGLYIWTSIYGVLITSQFWLLANYLFDPRQAKRLFPLLTAGAILGGILGGYFTR
ncbi:MAG: MFS transporter, partial [bacterium]